MASPHRVLPPIASPTPASRASPSPGGRKAKAQGAGEVEAEVGPRPSGGAGCVDLPRFPPPPASEEAAEVASAWRRAYQWACGAARKVAEQDAALRVVRTEARKALTDGEQLRAEIIRLRADVKAARNNVAGSSGGGCSGGVPSRNSPMSARANAEMAKLRSENKVLRNELAEAHEKARAMEARMIAFEQSAQRTRKEATAVVDANVTSMETAVFRADSETARWKRRHAALHKKYEAMRVQNERDKRKRAAQAELFASELKVQRNKYVILQTKYDAEVTKNQPPISKAMLLLHEKAAHWLDKYRVLKLTHEALVADHEALVTEHKANTVELRRARDKLQLIAQTAPSDEAVDAVMPSAVGRDSLVPAHLADTLHAMLTDADVAERIVRNPAAFLHASILSLEEHSLIDPGEALGLSAGVRALEALLNAARAPKVDVEAEAKKSAEEIETASMVRELQSMQATMARLEASAEQLHTEVRHWKAENRKAAARIAKLEALLREAQDTGHA
ncbi:uncharacterized protein AMSG_00210, partial [Thecamonas trahens ATCC 50062]